MSQAVTIPNPGRELAVQPLQPPTRSPGWGPRGPRPALHVPAPAAGSILGVRQRRMKLRRKIQGARPPRSDMGYWSLININCCSPKHPGPMLLLPVGFWRRKVPAFFPRLPFPSPSKGIRSTLKPWHHVLTRENTP